MMKNLTVPALAFACAFSAGVPAAAETAEPYNPVKALRGERAAVPANDDDRGSFVLPKEKRGSAVALAVAPEYFFDFGSDLPDGDGWGASLSAAVRFDTDTPNGNFSANWSSSATRRKADITRTTDAASKRNCSRRTCSSISASPVRSEKISCSRACSASGSASLTAKSKARISRRQAAEI